MHTQNEIRNMLVATNSDYEFIYASFNPDSQKVAFIAPSALIEELAEGSLLVAEHGDVQTHTIVFYRGLVDPIDYDLTRKYKCAVDTVKLRAEGALEQLDDESLILYRRQATQVHAKVLDQLRGMGAEEPPMVVEHVKGGDNDL